MIDRIFTFWEPNNNLTPYLELCKQTWETNLSAYEIVVVDHSNLNSFLGEDQIKLSVLKRIPLKNQKDAVMIALLRRHGGIFMDMDTIALRDISSIVGQLRRSEVVMFHTHLAFMAARPDSHILNLMFEGVQTKMAALESESTSMLKLNWDYLGNSELARAMDTIVSKQKMLVLPSRVVDRFIRSIKQRAGGETAWTNTLHTFLDRTNHFVKVRTRRLAFATINRHYLAMLNRDKYGFIAESFPEDGHSFDPHQSYLDFWFRQDAQLSEVFQKNPMIIGLHNSWTPDWYKKLNRREILSHDCLLSRTLRYVLSL